MHYYGIYYIVTVYRSRNSESEDQETGMGAETISYDYVLPSPAVVLLSHRWSVFISYFCPNLKLHLLSTVDCITIFQVLFTMLLSNLQVLVRLQMNTVTLDRLPSCHIE